MMNLYVVIIVLTLTVVARIALAHSTFEKFMDKRGKQVNILLGALFAILLVPLGVLLSAHESRTMETETVVSLLKNGQQDIYQTRQDIVGVYELLNRDQHSKRPAVAIARPKRLPVPTVFTGMLKNESVLKSLDEEMLESARAFQNNAEDLLTWYVTIAVADSQAAMFVYQYGVELWKIEEIVGLFIGHLEENTSATEFSELKQAVLRQNLALMFDPEIASRRRKHPWRKLGP